MPELIPVASDMVCSNDFLLPDHQDTIRGLAASGPARVVVTHGADPVTWWEGGLSGSVTVPSVKVVDTLGAGDAFHGAYAFYALSSKLDLAGRISLSIGVACTRVGVEGPRAWLAELDRWAQ